MKKKQELPLGISDFKAIIEEGYAYVDKTLFIQELIEKGAYKVSLITRPRRFGKTLNLSMLRYFFEKSSQDNSYLFTSLNIRKFDKYRALQGQYPVIFLTLKDIRYKTWESAFEKFRDIIAEEFRKHKYLIDGDTLDEIEKEQYFAILRNENRKALYVSTLKKLLVSLVICNWS